MSSCAFEELVSRVADMLNAGLPQEEIDRVLEVLSADYRVEVLAAARDLVRHARP